MHTKTGHSAACRATGDAPGSASAGGDLESQAARIRASGALGRSDLIRRLFDYLVERSARGDTPREIDIAVEVFGRTDGIDMSADATVRVYIHRLRRKLDDFFSGEGALDPTRLIIPKGEYRLAAVPQGSAEAARRHGTDRPRGTPPFVAWAAGVCLLLAANAAIWAWAWPGHGGRHAAAVSGHGIWAPIAADTAPILLVVGDYYIFGDTENAMGVSRLVREFAINSRQDLYEYLIGHPDLMGRYVDVGLRYLPVSVAPALTRLMPVLDAAGASGRLQVTQSSELTADMMRGRHIVYVGLLSGLGPLVRPVFGDSRFHIGSSFDEIVDRRTGRHYVSRADGLEFEDTRDRDFGFFATFARDDGTRMVIISGTRDPAVARLARMATTASDLSAIQAEAGAGTAFEAVIAVESVDRVRLAERLIAAAPR